MNGSYTMLHSCVFCLEITSGLARCMCLQALGIARYMHRLGLANLEPHLLAKVSLEQLKGAEAVQFDHILTGNEAGFHLNVAIPDTVCPQVYPLVPRRRY